MNAKTLDFRNLTGDRYGLYQVLRIQEYREEDAITTSCIPSVFSVQLLKSQHIPHGYTLKEIADHLEIHYTTAIKVINAFETT
jgi:hypothetical protein